MRRFVLSCLTGLAVMAGHPPSAGALELGNLLSAQTSTSAEALQVLNPIATPCLDIVDGCSVITLAQHSIELLHPDVSVGIDGSLTIEAIGSWTNARDLNTQQAKVVIRLPKRLRPLPLSDGRIPTTENQTLPSDKTATCTEQAPANGNSLSLTQLSEVLMGQRAISRSAALFTPGCHR